MALGYHHVGQCNHHEGVSRPDMEVVWFHGKLKEKENCLVSLRRSACPAQPLVPLRSSRPVPILCTMRRHSGHRAPFWYLVLQEDTEQEQAERVGKMGKNLLVCSPWCPHRHIPVSLGHLRARVSPTALGQAL